MDFPEIYMQYLDDIKQNVDTFNTTTVQTYIEQHEPHILFENNNTESKTDAHVNNETEHGNENEPFAMKLFQRRIQKYSSYKQNQEYIRRQNDILHTQIVEKVKKDKDTDNENNSNDKK